MRKTKKIGGSNVLVTVLLFLGCLTILFPLYMTIIIAFKSPSEMTNDVAGALAFPSSWKLDNFKEAMEVTNFWHTLGNSLLITIATIVLALLIHSLAGYVIGRNMARKKGYRFIYFYIVSGMFVPFAILMMPLVKETAILGLDNRLGVILLYLVFYMPINVMLYSGYLKNIPLAMEEANARNRCGSDRSGHLERRYDTTGNHVRHKGNNLAAGTVELPDTVRYKLQLGVCIVLAGIDSDSDFLCDLPEADFERCCKWCSKGLR